MTIRASLSVTLVLVAFGCAPPLKPDPHYVLGKPYQAGGVWFYPRETFEFNETGLAAVVTNEAARLTADGEVFDQTALTAGHPTIQLPAIARLTNLENGREVTVPVGTSVMRAAAELDVKAFLLQTPPIQN